MSVPCKKSNSSVLENSDEGGARGNGPGEVRRLNDKNS